MSNPAALKPHSFPPDSVFLALPTPISVGLNTCFIRNEIEARKALLTGGPAPAPSPIIELVSTIRVAEELGVHRRTVARYLRRAAELRAAAAAADTVAA